MRDGATAMPEGDSARDRPSCRLSGTDGNVFAVIAAVRRALRNAGRPERAREFVERAWAAASYDEVLRLCFEYVEVG